MQPTASEGIPVLIFWVAAAAAANAWIPDICPEAVLWDWACPCVCVCGDAPRTGDAIVVCNCVVVVCVGERIVGVMDGVTKVPPNVFVTVPGAKMRNPEGVVNGALTRTKLLVPEKSSQKLIS